MATRDANPLCEVLAWDSEFWGVTVGRVTRPALVPGDGRRIAGWCAEQGVTCLYLLASADDRATVLEAARAGFVLVDHRLTLGGVLAAGAPATAAAPPSVLVRPARAADLPALGQIAVREHRDSRFYADGRFPTDRCDALYATWIQRSYEGWADAVLVADAGGVAVGYVTGHLDAPGRGRIGIVGVGEAARGRGVGQALVRASLDWFAAHGATAVSVVTQGRNVQAQRLYQRCGFLTQAFGLWYHRWSDSEGVALEPPA